jgi:hypothetical protein
MIISDKGDQPMSLFTNRTRLIFGALLLCTWLPIHSLAQEAKYYTNPEDGNECFIEFNAPQSNMATITCNIRDALSHQGVSKVQILAEATCTKRVLTARETTYFDRKKTVVKKDLEQSLLPIDYGTRYTFAYELMCENPAARKRKITELLR